MKPRYFNPFRNSIKTTTQAIPMAALMLGAAHAGTTVGMNFQASYYGYGSYTGTVVTQTAFGVAPGNWVNSTIDSINDSMTINPSSGGSFNVAWAANSAGISWAAYGTPTGPVGFPGDASVFHGNIQGPYTVTLTNLATQFPHGYIVQPVAAGNYATGMRNISVSDGTTPETLSYTQKGQFDFGWGISGSYGTYAPSGTFTGDTFTITGDGNDGSVWSWLSGFIITDQPVINAEPVATSVPTGGTISLSASAIGVGTLTYQWKIGGVDIPGATASTFTKASASTGDAGDYTVVVTNVAGNVTSQTAHVTVAQPVSLTWDTDTGTSGGQAGSGTWDTSNSNWWNGTANVSWGAMDLATFGAGGVGTSTVTLAADTSISGLTFDGNYDITTSTGNTLTLAGTPTLAVNSDSSIHVSLLGTAAITKTGTGTLTLAGSGSTFTGATTINNGKLVLGSQRGLGATSGITLVAGTQVNLNGQSAGALSTGGYTWTIAGDGGDGAGGLGAIINTGGDLYGNSGIKNLALSGNAEIGSNNGRFDVGLHPGNGMGTIDGGGHTLTKVGSNAMVFRGPASNITYVVNAGSLTFEDTDAASGSNTITVNAGASLGTYGTRAIANALSLSAGAAMHNNGGGSGTWTGPITLTGASGTSVTINAGDQMNFSGTLTGSANLTVQGGSWTALESTGNTGFSGKVDVNGGHFRVAADSSLGAAPGSSLADAITLRNSGYLQGGTKNAGADVTLAANRGITISSGTGYISPWGGYTLTIGGAITGAGNLQKTDGGNAVFNGNVTLSGDLYAGGGSETFNGNLTLGGGIYLYAGSTTFNIGTGSATRMMLGDGWGYSHTVNQTAGVLNVGGITKVGHWPDETSTYNISGGSLNLPDTVTNTGDENQANLMLGIDGTGVLNLSGSGVVNTSSLVVNGRGEGHNGSNVDTLNLNGGRLNLGKWGIRTHGSTYAVNLGSGILGASADWSSSLNMTLTGNTTVNTLDSVNATTPRTITLSGALAGSGDLTKSGDGTLVLSSASNSYSGVTAVNGGKLHVGPSLPSSTVSVNSGGTLQPGTYSAAGTSVVSGLTMNGGAVSFRANFTAGDKLVVSGTDTFTVPVATTINVLPAGDLMTNDDIVLIDYTGAELSADDFNRLSVAALPNPHYDGTLVHDTANTAVVLHIGAADTITWTGAANGSWHVGDVGTPNWQLDSDGTTATNFFDRDVVTFNELGISQPTVTLTGTITPASVAVANMTGTYVFQGAAIDGTAGLTKTGDGGLTLLNNNTYTGLTAIRGGTVSVGNGGTSGALGGSGDITLANNATLVFDRSDTISLARKLVGAGSVVKQSAGTLTLSGAPSSINGTLQIDGGTVVLATNNYSRALGASTGIIVNAGTLRLSSTNVLYDGGGEIPVTVNAGGSVEIQTGSGGHSHFRTLNLNGATVVGVGTGMYANEYSTFDGTVTVGGSQMSTITRASGGNGVFSLNGGSFQVGDVTSGTDLLINAPLVYGALTKTGAGTLTLAEYNTYTGGTNVNGGTLSVASISDGGGMASIGVYSGSGGGNYLAIANDGVFQYTGTGAQSSARYLWMDTGSQTKTIDVVSATADLTFTGTGGNINKPIKKSGLGSLTIDDVIQTGATVTVDAGKLTLGGTNTYTGETTVNAGGTLVVDGDSLDNTSKLALNGSGKTQVSNTEVVGTLFIDGVQMNAGTYGATGSGATTIDTTHFSGTGVVQVTSGPLLGYDSWASQITNGKTLRTDDADDDGFTNLQEFLFGTSPIANTGSLTTTETSNGDLIIRWLERVGGTSYQLMQSSTLGNDWVVSGVSVVNDGAAVGDYQPKKATITLGAGKLFYRVEGVEN